MIAACKDDLADQVRPEFLQCQIEVGTRVCRNISEARDELLRLRSCVSKHAKAFGSVPIAASCHPFADWKTQHHTDRARYHGLRRDLAGIAQRMLICGMHVHIGVEHQEMRIDLMNQMSYFLPHLLALSCSSPFWQGDDTGLASYRLSVFDNLPRTGLPPQLASWQDFERSVDALIHLGTIEDGSKIWWDLRPSSKFPTIETRICDVPPDVEQTLTLAALIQSLSRYMWRLRATNRRWRVYDSFLLAENRWRAQRFGISEGLIDFGIRQIVLFPRLLEELIELVEQHAEVLGCLEEVNAARDIVKNGTSADRQRQVLARSLEEGASRDEALREVVKHLIEEFHKDL